MDKKRNKKIKSQEGLKKGKQAKDKCGAKKTMGTMQTDNQTKIFKCMLHVRKEWIDWEQLAYGAFMGKGIIGGVFKIRFESAKTAVLQLQYQPWGSRCRVLPQNVHTRGPGVYGKTGSRQTKISKRIRPLPETTGGIWGYTKIPV